MSDVTIPVPLHLLRTAVATLDEVGQDLAAEVSERLAGDHPVNVRRRNRDLEPAHRAARLVQQLRAIMPCDNTPAN